MGDAGRGSVDGTVLGWYEYVELPEWNIARLRAKVDTGARTSAIHVRNVQELPGDRVRFEVVLRRDGSRPGAHVEATVCRRGLVKVSTRLYQSRLFVRTRLRLGGHEHEIEVNLVDRTDMRFRMILGRTAFSGWPMLIDVNQACLLTPRPQRRRRAPRP